jgi:hypothetical protein
MKAIGFNENWYVRDASGSWAKEISVVVGPNDGVLVRMGRVAA